MSAARLALYGAAFVLCAGTVMGVAAATRRLDNLGLFAVFILLVCAGGSCLGVALATVTR